MKKLTTLFMVLLLVSCASLEKVSEGLEKLTNSLDGKYEPLTAKEVCDLIDKNIIEARKRYANGKFIFTGKISSMSILNANMLHGEQLQLGIQEASGRNIYAHIDNYKSQKIGNKGDKIQLKGIIADSNFTSTFNSGKSCFISLDNGKIVKKD